MIDSGLERKHFLNLHKNWLNDMGGQNWPAVTARGPKTVFALFGGGSGPEKVKKILLTLKTIDSALENAHFLRSWGQNPSDRACSHSKGSKNRFYPPWGGADP